METTELTETCITTTMDASLAHLMRNVIHSRYPNISVCIRVRNTNVFAVMVSPLYCDRPISTRTFSEISAASIIVKMTYDEAKKIA